MKGVSDTWKGGSYGGHSRKSDGHFYHDSLYRKSNQKDWREHLFSVFVDNLSCKVPKSALWEVFEAYGQVMDVYIGIAKSWRRQRGTTFAFVRFKSVQDMQHAVQKGNNRLIDKRHIRVKKASWLERCIITPRGDRCAMGQLKNSAKIVHVREALHNANISCSVCPVGGNMVALLFDSFEDPVTRLLEDELAVVQMGGGKDNKPLQLHYKKVENNDIAHRNSIIRREAAATWEISTVLGVVFDKDKNQMTDIFQRMEEEDLRTRGV
ncbi:hypothetical protein DITRI_Ditri08aG0023400 [Diplodiscus trichospermus]